MPALTAATLCLASATTSRQRGSRAYQFVALALAALVAQPILGGPALLLSRPDGTRTLFRTVVPGLAERLTDRFERLVDSLLDPPDRG